MKIRNAVAVTVLFFLVVAGTAGAQTSTIDRYRSGIYLGMFPLGVSGEPGTAEFVKYSLRLKLFGNSSRGQGGLAYFRTLEGGKFELNSAVASNFGADTLQFQVSPGGAQEIPLTSDGPLTFGSVTLPTDIIYFDMSDPLNSTVLGIAYIESRDKDGGILSSVPVPLARPAEQFMGDAEFTGEGRTWLAIMNPGNQPVVASLELHGSFKEQQSTRRNDVLSWERRVDPGQTITQYLNEIFPEVESGGFIPDRLDISASDGGAVVVNAYRVGKQITAVPVFSLR